MMYEEKEKRNGESESRIRGIFKKAKMLKKPSVPWEKYWANGRNICPKNKLNSVMDVVRHC